MKSNLGYSQKDVNLVISIGNAGGYVGIVVFGILFDFFGPFISALISSVCLFTGYFLMHWANKKAIPYAAVYAGLYLAFVGFGSNGGYFTGLITNIRNTKPKNRGKATGTLASLYGISAAVVAQFYSLFHGNVERFFLFLSIIVGLLPLSTSLCIRLVPLDVDEESDEYTPLLDEKENKSNTPAPFVGDYRLLSTVKTIEYVFLVMIAFFGTAIGVTYINIVSSVVKALRITSIPATTYVTVLSLSNTGGRLIVGFLLDLLRPYIREVAFFFFCAIIMCSGQMVLIFFGNTAILLVITVICGLTFGGFFALTPFIINYYFGDKNFGTNFALCTLPVSFGGLVFSYSSGAIYDLFAEIDPVTGEKSCFGHICYKYTFLMTTCSLVVAMAASFMLWMRERHVDKKKSSNTTINK